MRIGNPRQSRPDWYDRNPIVRFSSYNTGSVAPHSTTQRWTYTVPAGKKCAVQLASLNAKRQTLAGAAGIFQAWLRYTPSGGSALALLMAISMTATVGLGDALATGATMVLLAGDQLEGVTYDDSTTGTVYYVLTFQGIEYDA